MDKILYIVDCCFKLPEDFNGTIGEALLLLANYRLEKEQANEAEDIFNEEEESGFWNGTKRGLIEYTIDSKERIYNYRKEKTNIE